MNKVKQLLAMVKSNPLVVVPAVLVVVAVAALFAANATAHGVLDKVGHVNPKSIRKTFTQHQDLPGEKPGDSSTTESFIPNQVTIDALKEYFGRLDQQIESINKLAMDHNRIGVTAQERYADRRSVGHVPMDDRVFPKPSNAAAAYAPYDAKEKYLAIFKRMLGPYSNKSPYPGLNAGMPRPKEVRQEMLDKVKEIFTIDQTGGPTAGTLSPRERENLKASLRKMFISTLTQDAQSIHIYAESADQVFDIGQWASSGEVPSLHDLWIGQMELWIQQDIVEAIARVNQVDNDRSNVINAPIKRLVGIKVEKAYVGDREREFEAGRITTRRSKRSTGPHMGHQQMQMQMPSRWPAPGMSTGAANQTVNAFTQAHTGRVSNDRYDVWHAKVTLVADARRLPLFFNALAKVNFMTVLELKITDVDEYKALRDDGFIYTGDAVRMEAVIETLWLRDWTEPLMPQEIKQLLGINRPAPGEQIDAGSTTTTHRPRGPSRYGATTR